MKKFFILYALILAGIYGCGSNLLGSTPGGLSTSVVTATATTSILDSDVANWKDVALCSTDVTAAGLTIPAADSVDISFSSKAYSNTGSMGLPVLVESATVSYTPANVSTPPMASEYQTIGMTVANGATATIPVRVSTQEQKSALLSALACGGPIYNYYTTITLHVSEIGTDKTASISTKMQLRIADFIDK